MSKIPSESRDSKTILAFARYSTSSCSAGVDPDLRFPLYTSILAVSLIACIIRYRLIAFDLTRSLRCIAESSFGEPINFNFLLGALLVCFFWVDAHCIPFC
jgi:hypothetical protein